MKLQSLQSNSNEWIEKYKVMVIEKDKDTGIETEIEKWRCECGRQYDYKRSLQSHWNRCVLAPLEHPNAKRIFTKIVRKVNYMLPKAKSIKGDKYIKSTFRGYPLSLVHKLARNWGYGYMRGVDYDDEYFTVQERKEKRPRSNNIVYVDDEEENKLLDEILASNAAINDDDSDDSDDLDEESIEDDGRKSKRKAARKSRNRIKKREREERSKYNNNNNNEGDNRIMMDTDDDLSVSVASVEEDESGEEDDENASDKGSDELSPTSESDNDDNNDNIEEEEKEGDDDDEIISVGNSQRHSSTINVNPQKGRIITNGSLWDTKPSSSGGAASHKRRVDTIVCDELLPEEAPDQIKDRLHFDLSTYQPPNEVLPSFAQSVSSSSSLESKLPELTGIFMPCFVKTMRKAYDILEDKSTVHDTIHNQVKFLRTRFDKRDPLRQGPVASLEQEHGLLLKVKRNKRTGECSVEPTGIVKTAYKYQELGDVQFLPLHGKVDLEQETTRVHPVIESIPRPFMSTHINDKEYPLFNVKTYVQKNMNDYAAHRAKERSKSQSHATHIKFEDEVPMHKPKIDLKLRGENKRRGDVYIKELDALFKARPCWSKKMIENTGKFRGGEYLLLQVLPKVAYHYLSGPWKGTWIRYGYDPSKDPNARYLQQINVRVSWANLQQALTELQTKIGQRLATHTRVNLNTFTVWDLTKRKSAKIGLNLFLFNEDIKSQFSIQACDLLHDSIYQHFLRKMPRLETCDKTSGWFSGSNMTQLRELIASVYHEKLKSFLNSDLEFSTGSEGNIIPDNILIARAADTLTNPPFVGPTSEYLESDAPPSFEIDAKSSSRPPIDWYNKLSEIPDYIDLNSHVSALPTQKTNANSSAIGSVSVQSKSKSQPPPKKVPKPPPVSNKPGDIEGISYKPTYMTDGNEMQLNPPKRPRKKTPAPAQTGSIPPATTITSIPPATTITSIPPATTITTIPPATTIVASESIPSSIPLATAITLSRAAPIVAIAASSQNMKTTRNTGKIEVNDVVKEGEEIVDDENDMELLLAQGNGDFTKTMEEAASLEFPEEQFPSETQKMIEQEEEATKAAQQVISEVEAFDVFD